MIHSRGGSSRKRPAVTDPIPFHLDPVPAPDNPWADLAPFAGDDRPQRLAAAIGIEPRDPGHYRTALTHRSILHELAAQRPGIPLPSSNERLEFLGDAVLGLVVARDLYDRFPESQEGDLTAWRVALVRAERLVVWAREIDLGGLLYLGAGERITENARDRMLGGAFEAVIGAIALDQGLEGARDFVLRFARRDLDAILAHPEPANPKGRLQELLQERHRKGPTYRITDAQGPDHARIFTAEALLEDAAIGSGIGASKREAEQAAAADALRQLLVPSAPPPDPTAV